NYSMRLLNVDTLGFADFADDDIPRYAIASHRWHALEATIDDILEGRNKNVAGYHKIYNGVGWTLQELLAPQTVVFLDKGWNVLGHKGPFPAHPTPHNLNEYVSVTARVPEDVLRDYECSKALSAEERVGWVLDSVTTRIEDRAYCLLGIFDIHMPMIYGEGKRAFYRLTEEIEKKAKMDDTVEAMQLSLITSDYTSNLDEAPLQRHHRRTQSLPETLGVLSALHGYQRSPSRNSSRSTFRDDAQLRPHSTRASESFDGQRGTPQQNTSGHSQDARPQLETPKKRGLISEIFARSKGTNNKVEQSKFSFLDASPSPALSLDHHLQKRPRGKTVSNAWQYGSPKRIYEANGINGPLKDGERTNAESNPKQPRASIPRSSSTPTFTSGVATTPYNAAQVPTRSTPRSRKYPPVSMRNEIRSPTPATTTQELTKQSNTDRPDSSITSKSQAAVSGTGDERASSKTGDLRVLAPLRAILKRWQQLQIRWNDLRHVWFEKLNRNLSSKKPTARRLFDLFDKTEHISKDRKSRDADVSYSRKLLEIFDSGNALFDAIIELQTTSLEKEAAVNQWQSMSNQLENHVSLAIDKSDGRRRSSGNGSPSSAQVRQQMHLLSCVGAHLAHTAAKLQQICSGVDNYSRSFFVIPWEEFVSPKHCVACTTSITDHATCKKCFLLTESRDKLRRRLDDVEQALELSEQEARRAWAEVERLNRQIANDYQRPTPTTLANGASVETQTGLGG
ncbi:Vegetative incompatibility protein HET-E-1, partial [Pseudocercospora fuligena]